MVIIMISQDKTRSPKVYYSLLFMAWMAKMLERLKVQLVMALAMFPPSIFDDGEVSIFLCVFLSCWSPL
jgi:hypothetical protein